MFLHVLSGKVFLMNCDIVIPLTVDTRVFNLFLLTLPKATPLTGMSIHNHYFAEIHLVLEGSILFSVEQQQYEVSAGQAILLPATIFHSSVALQPGTTEYAFNLTADITGCHTAAYSKEIVAEIKEAMDVCNRLGQVAPMIPWFFRFVTDLVLKGRFQEFGHINYSHLIHEYLNDRYNRSPSLLELAQYLGISVKQTQRIIQKETGHTFTQEVVARRMHIAEHLFQHSNMTNEEIAVFVGYQTYAGFWKARKRFLKAKNEGSAQE